MEEKFSNGDWEIEESDFDDDGYVGISSTGGSGGWHQFAQVVVEVSGVPDEEGIANSKLLCSAKDLYLALKNVNQLIAEGAAEGFNPQKGDWAEKLFYSQQQTSNALKKL